MKKGKLIVIEGSDGSGKETQSTLLFEKLEKKGEKVKRISFPNYQSESSACVKKYLKGGFGSLEEVNIFAASIMFSVDRFASFKEEWEDFYNNGGIVIADRYTTANMIHQGCKFEDKKEKDSYLEWISNLEFNLCGLPKPDVVFFLDVKPEVSMSLRKNRKNKITKEEKQDIHESNIKYMVDSYKNAIYVSDKMGWIKIDCNEGESIKDIESINKEIINFLENL